MVDRSNCERLRGFGDRQTDRQTDICYSRVTVATENIEAECWMTIYGWMTTSEMKSASSVYNLFKKKQGLPLYF